MSESEKEYNFLENLPNKGGNKLTDQDIMKMLNISKDKWYAYKKNPGKAPTEILFKLAEGFGMSINELINYRPPEFPGVFPECKWTPVVTAQALIQKIENSRVAKSIKEDLIELVKKACGKIKIAIVGSSDAGKTTIINYTLGGDPKLKQAYTATTSSKVYIISSKDKPKNITDDALILKDYDIDIDRLSDDNYLHKKLIASGTSSIITDYCTHFGEKYEEYKDEIITAVLYHDSPLLDLCILIDTPGFGTGNNSNDDKIAFTAKNEADIILFLSPVLGFMNEKDQAFVKNCVKTLKSQSRDGASLENLFILGSQAQIANGGDKETLELTLNSGCNKLFDDSSESFWANVFDKPVTKGELRSRFYSFSTNMENKPFVEDFKCLLQTLPERYNDRAKKIILDYINDTLLTAKKEYERLSKSLTKYLNSKEATGQDTASLLKAGVDNLGSNEELKFNKTDADAQQKELLDYIEQLRKASKDGFTSKYNEIINPKHIQEVISEKSLKRKKDDYQRLSNILQDELNSNLDSILAKYSKVLSSKIDNYLKNFEKITIKRKGIAYNEIGNIFNVKGLFSSALAGAAAYGGLAYWASTFGNLGGYILIAKGVSVLSALGISIAGGTATVISAISAIGGPVTLGITIALITAVSTFGIFSKSKSWQKTLAGKIVKEYGKKDALGKYMEIINTYWDNTADAFKQASDSLVKELEEKIAIQNENIKNGNEEKLRKVSFEAEAAYRDLDALKSEILDDLS